MIFKGTIAAVALREAIKSVSDLVIEARINLSEKGLEIRSVDPANVAMVALTIKPGAFKSFEASEGQLGVDLTRLEDLLSGAGKEDLVTLSLLTDEQKLKISYGNLSYKMGLIAPEHLNKEPHLPDIDFAAMAALAGAEIRKFIKAATKLNKNEAAVLGMNDDYFYATTEASTEQVTMRVMVSTLLEVKLGQVESCYPLAYLRDMSRSLEKAEVVKMRFGNDFPLSIFFRLGQDISVNYLLAPRIEAEP